MQKAKHIHFKKGCCIILVILFSAIANAQQPAANILNDHSGKTKPVKSILHSIAGDDADLFGKRTNYIENAGQYGDTLAYHGKMGKILFGYEGAGMPVLFTTRGLMHLQRKIKPLSHEEMEEMEENGLKPQDKIKPIDRVVTMEWINGNTDPQIITEEAGKAYLTYGLLKEKGRTFKKIIYKEIYPGVDLLYSFIETKKAGFEFSLQVRPGADISRIKLKYGGDVNDLIQDKEGNLIIKSDIDEITVSKPVYYYAGHTDQQINASFIVSGNEIGFSLPENYDPKKILIIDPFILPTTTLTGSGGNAEKATDIDFDYDGNIYVSGGGDGSTQKLAKFNKSGILQWTFSGSISSPSWEFGPSHGGWVVEKTTGNIYLGQGLASGGFRVIRLNSAGIYDNYITTADLNFSENWKMLWSCNGGVPKILIAGGGGTANNELAILTPPGQVPATSNISGLPGGHNDISDIIIDPVSNEMFTLFSVSVLTPAIDCKIYKHAPPYTPANIAWSAFTGYFSVKEPFNRPYSGITDNSSNTIAINSDYLFFWDGKNLKAFDKATGNVAGTALTFANTVLMQGGIFADECNNVFIGSTNGTIKVYNFNGSVFNDAAAADITIPGFTTNSVYDITFDHANNLIYTCGDGFVASIDVSQYCASLAYTLTIFSDPVNLTATASLNPAAAPGSVVTFSLFNGPLLISSNTTGIFTGLSLGITYTVKAFINQSCGGTQVTKDFILNGTVAPPAIYVPNAFAPGGINDKLKIALYGMQALHYFSVYNRYGQLIFTTKDPAVGWDGKFKGKAQKTGTFVWAAEAVDLRGNIIREKGTSILIR